MKSISIKLICETYYTSSSVLLTSFLWVPICINKKAEMIYYISTFYSYLNYILIHPFINNLFRTNIKLFFTNKPKLHKLLPFRKSVLTA